MKTKYHVNQTKLHINRRGLWPRGSEVEVDGYTVRCLVDCEREYSLTKEYKYSPHAKFLNATTNERIAGFVRAYGPLTQPFQRDFRHGERFSEPVAAYQHFREWLRARLELVRALKKGVGLKQSLRAYVLATGDARDYGARDLYEIFCSLHPPKGRRSAVEFPAIPEGAGSERMLDGYVHPPYESGLTMEEWVDQAKEIPLRNFAAFAIQQSFSFESGMEVILKTHSAEIEARSRITTLQNALQWMFWNDEYLSKPLLHCPECNTEFRPEGARKQKFCTNLCAHRASARDWSRLHRRKKKHGSKKERSKERRRAI